MTGPIDEGLHRYREEHTRKFNFDLAAIGEDLRALQRSRNLKVVRLPPKRISPQREDRVRPGIRQRRTKSASLTGGSENKMEWRCQ